MSSSDHFIQHTSLSQRIDHLEAEFRKLRDQMNQKTYTEADVRKWQTNIEDYLIEQKKQGRTTVGLLDIYLDLSIPVEYADKIMKKLESKGVKEVV